MEMTFSLDVVVAIITACWFIQRKLNVIDSKIDKAIARIDGHDETLKQLETGFHLLQSYKDEDNQVNLTLKVKEAT